MDGLEFSEINLLNLERTKRIDAEFYQKANIAVEQTLRRWDKRAFSNLFNISDGNHMSISDNFCESGIPYYRGQDIYHLFIETANPIRIDEMTFNRPQMKRSHLQKGDILMSIVGAIIGNSAIVTTKEDATCSCKLSIMRAKSNEISPEVLLIFIKTCFGQNQIQKFKRGAAQTGLLLEDFDQLFIPLFNEAFQKEVCNIVNKIYKLTLQSYSVYAQAEQRLLSALGLAGFSASNECVTIKSFSDSFAKTGRFDAEYYQLKYDELLRAIYKHKVENLGGNIGLVYIQKSIEPGSDAYCEDGIPFIRVSDITKFGITEPNIKLSPEIISDISSLYPIKDTILLSKDGSVGIAYKVEHNLSVVTSGALLHLKIKDQNEILPDYLTLVLNSPIVQLQAERDASGAIIQHWKPSEIERVAIPMLDMPVQKQIAETVQESFTLRHQSEQMLESAKRAVEIAIEQGEDKAIDWLKEREVEG